LRHHALTVFAADLWSRLRLLLRRHTIALLRLAVTRRLTITLRRITLLWCTITRSAVAWLWTILGPVPIPLLWRTIAYRLHARLHLRITHLRLRKSKIRRPVNIRPTLHRNHTLHRILD